MKPRQGLDSLQQKQQEQTESIASSGNLIRYMRLRDDKEQSRFRVMTPGKPIGTGRKILIEGEEIEESLINAEFHNVQRYSSKGTPFWSNIMCGLDPETGEGECEYCDQGINKSTQFLVWVYVYYILHAGDNPAAGKTFRGVEQPHWRPETLDVGGLPVVRYREEVNGLMIWMGGYRVSLKLGSKYGKYGLLPDRDFELTRFGIKNSNQVEYELDGCDPTPCIQDALDKLEKVPALYYISTGDVETMDGKKLGQKSRVRATDYPELDLSQEELDDLPF